MQNEDRDKSSCVDTSQLIDFGSTSAASGLVGQELAVVPSQMASTGQVEMEPGTADIMPGVASAPAQDTPLPVFTDETPV